MSLNTLEIIIVIAIAAAIIIFLIWRNLKDEKDIDTELTDELEKSEKRQDNIK
jgi:preprotein translocase subunit YajC